MSFILGAGYDVQREKKRERLILSSVSFIPPKHSSSPMFEPGLTVTLLTPNITQTLLQMYVFLVYYKPNFIPLCLAMNNTKLCIFSNPLLYISFCFPPCCFGSAFDQLLICIMNVLNRYIGNNCSFLCLTLKKGMALSKRGQTQGTVR